MGHKVANTKRQPGLNGKMVLATDIARMPRLHRLMRKMNPKNLLHGRTHPQQPKLP